MVSQKTIRTCVFKNMLDGSLKYSGQKAWIQSIYPNPAPELGTELKKLFPDLEPSFNPVAQDSAPPVGIRIRHDPLYGIRVKYKALQVIPKVI